MEKIVKILNDTGLHARPTGIFVKMASQFEADIQIEFNGALSNGKSIMNLLSLGLKKGDEIKIITNGKDEVEAMEALTNLIDTKFGE